MAGMAAGETPASPPAMAPGRRRAAGIYGAIITAAIIASGGDTLSTRALEVSVVVTLLVYWIAAAPTPKASPATWKPGAAPAPP
jgi:hypothetical protein